MKIHLNLIWDDNDPHMGIPFVPTVHLVKDGLVVCGYNMQATLTPPRNGAHPCPHCFPNLSPNERPITTIVLEHAPARPGSEDGGE